MGVTSRMGMFGYHARCAFAALAILAPASAFGDACDRAVDLRRNGPVEGLPSPEQGDTYACGFFAAATYLDAFQTRREGGLKPARLPIDPIALGVDLAAERDRSPNLPIQLTSDPLSDTTGRRGSYLCDILADARDRGICDPGDARVLDREWMHRRSNTAMALYERYLAFARGDDADRKRNLRTLVAKTRAALVAEGTRPPADEAIADALWRNRDAPYRMVRAILYPKCEDQKSHHRVFRDLPACRDRYFASLDAFGVPIGRPDRRIGRVERAIHAGLDARDALPVPILHCFGVFREGKSFRGRSILSDDCILHYVNVIGRRKRGGTCQFLVRNSYDPRDEDAVSKDWERDGEDFWIDSDLFAWSAYGVHRVED